MAAVATQGSTYEVIEITGRAGGTIDLRLGVSSFQYFEDIMSPVCLLYTSDAADE